MGGGGVCNCANVDHYNGGATATFVCKNLLLYKMYLCKWQKVFVQIRLKHYYPKCRAFCARLARRGIWLLNRLGVKWAVFGGGAALLSSPLS